MVGRREERVFVKVGVEATEDEVRRQAAALLGVDPGRCRFEPGQWCGPSTSADPEPFSGDTGYHMIVHIEEGV
ncbi:MAG: hypothetical protein HYT46_02490 [Candidatus Vogelbacteria bacterium]|nr:hypothetical protein [Candidatus Vogelbacteria bacterium]